MTTFTYAAVARTPHRMHVKYLRSVLPKAGSHVIHAPRNVSVALVGDTKMAAIHRRFLKIDDTTDVLTFELEHDPRGRCIDGEIVICVPHARRQARRYKTDIRHELLLYALHGLLHLSGHDDRSAGDYRKMHAMEDKILRAIGIGDVFARTS